MKKPHTSKEMAQEKRPQSPNRMSTPPAPALLTKTISILDTPIRFLLTSLVETPFRALLLNLQKNCDRFPLETKGIALSHLIKNRVTFSARGVLPLSPNHNIEQKKIPRRANKSSRFLITQNFVLLRAIL